MNELLARRIAAASGFLAVVLGAAGAHGPVHEILVRLDTHAIWETAVLYHLVHAVVLLVLSGRATVPRGPFFSFLIGQVLFSGSLYVLALTGIKWLGAITPLGGIGLLIGWIWLLF